MSATACNGARHQLATGLTASGSSTTFATITIVVKYSVKTSFSANAAPSCSSVGERSSCTSTPHFNHIEQRAAGGAAETPQTADGSGVVSGM